MQEYELHDHEFPPLYAPDSKILILGSFPSVKSRAAAFYYGHPQNRFWKVLAAVLGEPLPQTIAEKREMVLRRKIALWDAIESCEIRGSSDTSIKNVVPTDIPWLLTQTQIKAVFTNGAKSDSYYVKYNAPRTGITSVKLPSTSPANAAFSLEKLTNEWSVIREALEI